MAFLCRIYEVHRYFISYQARSGFSVYLPAFDRPPPSTTTWLAAGMYTHTHVDKQTRGGGGRRDERRGPVLVYPVCTRSRGRWLDSRVQKGMAVESRGSFDWFAWIFFFLTYVRSREHVVKWCRSMRGIDCFFRGAKRKRREREGSFYAWKEAGLIRFRRWKYLSKGSFFSLFFFFWGWMGGCFCERKLGFNGMWKFFWKININERCFFFWLN